MSESCRAPHTEHCEFAEKSAEAAVKKTFAILGVDICEPKDVKEFQDDLRFGNKLRKIVDKSVLTFAVAMVTAAVGAFLYGIKAKMLGP